jgi:hypothetical protein
VHTLTHLKMSDYQGGGAPKKKAKSEVQRPPGVE